MTSLAHFEIEPFDVYDGDLPASVYAAFAEQPQIAWDIETSGLDWETDRIALCQLYAAGLPVAVVRIGAGLPGHLRDLLCDPQTRKIFHHAMFDLRFMAHAWEVHPQNIACTKIAAKLLYPGQPQEQQLRALLARLRGVEIDKSEQRSNWLAVSLTRKQLQYAINDVIHLPQLLDDLIAALEREGLADLAAQCFAHIPTRVALELGAFGDVFTY